MIGFLAHFISKDSSDEDPFDLLVNLYSDHYKLWRYKTSKILQTDDVDDIIHDVFMRILSSHLDFSRHFPSQNRSVIFQKRLNMKRSKSWLPGAKSLRWKILNIIMRDLLSSIRC